MPFVLPDFPKFNTSEFVFSIDWSNARKFIDDEVDLFIKGLHYIEESYKLHTGYDFGFGSPWPTAKVIEALEESDPERAAMLREWVSRNGGNYYIAPMG